MANIPHDPPQYAARSLHVAFVGFPGHHFDTIAVGEACVLDELAHMGHVASLVHWAAPHVDWTRFDLVLPRYVWDYIEDLPAFEAWLQRVARLTHMANSPATVLRNARKRYLRELHDAGVLIVPTLFVDAPPADGASLLRAAAASPLLAAAIAAAGGLVAKPEVGGGASQVLRVLGDRGAVSAAACDALAAHVRALLDDRPGGIVLVQPFAESIVREGEYSVIVFGGEVSHVVVKRPARDTDDFRVQEMYGGTTTGVADADVPDGLVDAAMRALRAWGEDVLYARVDMARVPAAWVPESQRAGYLDATRDSAFALVELELIEPVLFMQHGAGTYRRFARAIDAYAQRALPDRGCVAAAPV